MDLMLLRLSPSFCEYPYVTLQACCVLAYGLLHILCNIYIYAYMGMYLCIINPKKNSKFCMKLCSGVWMRDGACLGVFRAVHEISQAPVTHVRMLRLEPRLDSVSPPFHRIHLPRPSP